jgi:hypothetical protein
VLGGGWVALSRARNISPESATKIDTSPTVGAATKIVVLAIIIIALIATLIRVAVVIVVEVVVVVSSQK